MGREINHAEVYGSGRSVEDQLIDLAALGKSPEAISAEIGGILSPAQVMLKTRDLFKAGDWLTEKEKERALLMTLERRVYRLQNDNSLEAVKVQAGIIKQLLSERRQATDRDVQTYNQNVGQQLGHVVDLVMTYMRGALRDVVDPVRWGEMLEEAMVMAAAEIAKKQIDS